MTANLIQTAEELHKDMFDGLLAFIESDDDELLLPLFEYIDFAESLVEMNIGSLENQDNLLEEISMIEELVDEREFGSLKFLLGASNDFQKASMLDSSIPYLIACLLD